MLQKNKIYILMLVVLLTLFSAIPTRAGVKVVLTDKVGPDQYFLVTTKISNHALHGAITDSLDESFMTGGEVKNITVLMTKPLIYNKVYSQAIHPAYYGAFASSEKKPSLLRSVRLELNDPKSWRSLLDTDAPVRDDGASLNANYINDHFRMMLQYYLPAYDRHGVTEPIDRYLPLFRKMAVFAHSETAHQRYRDHLPRYQKSQEDYEKYVTLSEGRVLGELDQRLQLIEAMLRIERGLRRKMHDWKKMFHKGHYVYREIMDDHDRKKLQEFMELNRERTTRSDLEWDNRNGVHFRAPLNSRYVMKNKDGSRSQDSCYSLSISTDLNPIIGFRVAHYSKRSHARICRNDAGVWELR